MRLILVEGRPELAEVKKLRKEVADQQRTIEIFKAAPTRRQGRSPPSSTAAVTGSAALLDGWQENAADMSVEVLQRVGHFIPEEAPAAVAARVEEMFG